MVRTKKVMALSMATIIALSPVAVKAENIEDNNIISIEEEVKVETPKYIEFKGKIVDINSKDKHFSILLENDSEEGMDKLIVHVPEDMILVNAETMDFVSREELKNGMEASIFYPENTPMALSNPPQLTPKVIVLGKEETNNVLVDRFDEDLLNSAKNLKILVNDDIEIIDEEGNKVKKEDLKDRDLIIFYDIVLRSYPGQTTPKKIIVLNEDELQVPEEENELKVLDKIIINEEKVELEDSLYENEDGVVMVPLRQIGEKLGYEVEWDHETSSASLTKSLEWTRVTIGKDQYNFAKMLIKLGTAPELKGEKTYVPMTFLEEVLKTNLEFTQDGLLQINK